MLKDEVKTVSNTPPQITKDTNPVDSLLKISFLRNYALPLIIRDPGLYDLDAFYDHPLLSCLTAGSPHYDTYESAFQQYEKETQQVYFDEVDTLYEWYSCWRLATSVRMITMLGVDRFIEAVAERYRMPQPHSQLLRSICNDQNRASWSEAAYLSFFPSIWFILDRELGYSSNSSTQLAVFNPPYRLRHETPKAYDHYALKRVDPELDSEVTLLISSNFQVTIETFYQGVTVDEDGSLMIVMTYSEYGNLEQNICRSRPTRWKEILEMMEDTTGHLCMLHSHHWIHNNLHPKNILLMQDGESPMISDFAYASHEPDKRRGNTHGRHPYIAPEIPTMGHSTASDVFALGIILWQLVSRVTFPDNALLDRHIHRIEFVPGMLDGLWNLIKSCLSYHPSQRPSAEDILSQLTQLHSMYGENYISDETIDYINHRANETEDYLKSHRITRDSIFSVDCADDGIIHTASVTRSSNEHLGCYLGLLVF